MDFKKFDNKKMIDLLLNGETITEMEENEQGTSHYEIYKYSLVINSSAGILSFEVRDNKSRSQSLYLSRLCAGKYIPKEFPNSMHELEYFTTAEEVSIAKE